MKKLLIRAAILLIVCAGGIAGAVAYKRAEKASKEEALLQELFVDLTTLDLDEPGRAYVNGLAEAAHADAIAAAFIPGGLMGGTYDVNVYQRTSVDRMIARARADGSTHVAEELEKFRNSGSRLDLFVPAVTPRGG